MRATRLSWLVKVSPADSTRAKRSIAATALTRPWTADFEDAIKLGGGPEVQRELDKLPPKPKAVPAPAKPPPPRQPSAPGADPVASDKTDRLRAALARKPPAPDAPAAPSPKVPTKVGAAAQTAKPTSPLPPNELLKEVSTRRLTPANGGSSFAQKKEQRQTRLGNAPGAYKSTAVSPPPATSSSIVAPSALSDQPPPLDAPPASSTPQLAPPSVPLEQLSLAEREIALSPAWQSMAETKYVFKTPSTTSQVVAASASATTAPLANGRKAGPAVTSWVAFERAWTAGGPLSAVRTDLLQASQARDMCEKPHQAGIADPKSVPSQSLSPQGLPALFGDALTPDLLSDIVRTLAQQPSTPTPEQAAEESSWKVDLLRGLTKVRRWDVGVMFMDEQDKALLLSVFRRAREALAHLEKQWDL